MAGQWFSLRTPVSSTNKTDRHDITKPLLKVALNTITSKPYLFIYLFIYLFVEIKYFTMYSPAISHNCNFIIVSASQFNTFRLKSTPIWDVVKEHIIIINNVIFVINFVVIIIISIIIIGLNAFFPEFIYV
jgi:hypothetical protein